MTPSRAGLRGALFVAGLLLAAPTLSGCVGAAAGVGAAAAVGQVPTYLTIVNDAITGIKTLTEVEQLACSVQASANAANPPDRVASYYWGLGCKW